MQLVKAARSDTHDDTALNVADFRNTSPHLTPWKNLTDKHNTEQKDACRYSMRSVKAATQCSW